MLTGFAAAVQQPGLVWGIALGPDGPRHTEDCSPDGGGSFRWLHFSLAHQGTVDWIAHAPMLPPAVKELLLAPDRHPSSLVEDGVVACVIPDFERDFEPGEVSRVGALLFALTSSLMITARLHPVRSPDLVRSRLMRGAPVSGPAAALELLVTTISGDLAGIIREAAAALQKAEDDFLEDREQPSARDLIAIRRRLAKIHRLLTDLKGVLRRLEEDEDLPEALYPSVEKLVQRVQALDSDAFSALAELRQLRDEIDMQADQRTNQNLYILSILTALMLPATFVTGLFGMNTGGLPWASAAHGTLLATILAFAAAAGSYVLLRWMGFMRR